MLQPIADSPHTTITCILLLIPFHCLSADTLTYTPMGGPKQDSYLPPENCYYRPSSTPLTSGQLYPGSLGTTNCHPRIVIICLWSIPTWLHTYFRETFSPGCVNFSNNGQSLARNYWSPGCLALHCLRPHNPPLSLS